MTGRSAWRRFPTCVVLSAPALAALMSLAAGCGQPRPAAPVRIAVLAFENLTGEAALDWVANSAAGVITTQLAQAPDLRAVAAGSVSDARALRASRALQCYLTVFRGRMQFRCAVEDLARGRTLRTVEAEGDAAQGPYPLIDRLARALSRSARPFPTRSQDALRLLTLASNAEDFRRAAAADPDFPLPYLGWARWLAARGRRQEALEVLEAARARQAGFPPVERAEVAVLEANLKGDGEARIRALKELAGLTPSDPQPPRALGQLEYAAWRFEPAENWYRRAVASEPDNPELWNMIGYAEAQRGAFEEARRSLAEYSRLAPEDPNAQDSMGEVCFMQGDFAGAEARFLEAVRLNPSWRGGAAGLKAAWARAMTGDIAGADELHRKYLDLRSTLRDPLIPYRQAQWEFFTGRRREAMDRMEAFRAGAQGDAAAFAAAQLALWKRQTGDRAGARRMAVEAERRAVSDPARRLAAILSFVTGPQAGAAEWSRRAERSFLQPGEAALRPYALSYALLLEGYFAEAAQSLERLLRQTHPAQAGDLRTLALWALVEAGRLEQARPLANVISPPEPLGDQTFASLAMPRLLEVHARLAPPQKAERLRVAWAKLKGDLPDAAVR